MFLKQSKSWKGTYLSFVQGYRENNKVKHKTIEKLGYLEDLRKEFPDPISHFKKIASEKATNEINELLIKNINTKKLNDNSHEKNAGYLILKKMYRDLELSTLFQRIQTTSNCEYSLDEIMQLLVYSRILYPGSKKETFDNKDKFFEDFDFTLKDLYRSLDNFTKYKDDVCKTLWENTKNKYNRDTSTTYYDCTNYYFEISYNDADLIDEEGNILEKGFRKKGPSKEKRKTPIIGMGLLMDKTNIPLSYTLFPGNESEKDKIIPHLQQAKRDFNLKRTIIVADRGLNTSDNTLFIAHKNDDKKTNHDGYIYGQSIIGSSKEFKEWAINPEGFIKDIIVKDDTDDTTYLENNNIIFRHKSRIFAKTIQIKRDGKRTNKYDIYQKQLVYYSQKYADRQKRLRDETVLKAIDLINNRGKYTKSTSYGANKYINNIAYDKKTGEIPEGLELTLKKELIKEEEKYDGFYSIVTSELNMSDLDIRNAYKGLWKIEETFKITKTNLKTRPVYVWTKEHIESHFLTCFVSLVIMRLLEIKLENKISMNNVIKHLKNYNCTKVEHDLYIFNYYNSEMKLLSNIFNINLDKKYRFLSEIKKITLK